MPVSINDRGVGTCEQVLNVLIACHRYGPGKPSSWLSTEACLFPTSSLAVMGEKLGMDQPVGVLWVGLGVLLRSSGSVQIC
jgi:hypothetical protein